MKINDSMIERPIIGDSRVNNSITSEENFFIDKFLQHCALIYIDARNVFSKGERAVALKFSIGLIM